MAETRPKNYPKLKNYVPSRFMLPTSHYDAEKADRAVRFIENLRPPYAGTCSWRRRPCSPLCKWSASFNTSVIFPAFRRTA